MIPRYTRPEMAAIWSDQNKYKIWYLIEAHATEKLAELGVVPQSAVNAVWKARDVEFDVDRINEIEAEVKHDVIAFLTHLAEHVGEESRFVHQGLTSSDVLDTCLAVQLKQTADLLLVGLDRVLAALKTRAEEHKFTIQSQFTDSRFHQRAQIRDPKPIHRFALLPRSANPWSKANSQICAFEAFLGSLGKVYKNDSGSNIPNFHIS